MAAPSPRPAPRVLAAVFGLLFLVGVQLFDSPPATAPDPVAGAGRGFAPAAGDDHPAVLPDAGPPPGLSLEGFEIGPPVPLPPGEPAVGLWDCRRAAEFGLRQQVDLSALGLAGFEGDSGAFAWRCDGVWKDVGPMRYAASVLCHVTNDETGVAELMPARVELTLEAGDQLAVADRQVRDWRCRRLPVADRPADPG